MADYLSTIEEMYNKLYKSKENDILKKKQDALADLDSQKTSVNNQYQEVANTLNTKKDTTKSQYQGLYTGLDNQQTAGKEQYYQDRNGAALGNVQKIQQIRDYMARNNIVSSGENVDAMLRSNTDYNNNLGSIYNNEQKFNRDISDTRTKYASEEQNTYNDINNQLSAADRDKAQKVSDLLNRIRLTNEGATSELQSYRDELDAKKMSEINNYYERLRQEQVQREEQERQRQYEAQQAAEQRAWQEAQAQKEYERQLAQKKATSSGSSSRSTKSSSSARTSSSGNNSATLAWEEFNKQFNAGTASLWLDQYKDSLKNSVGTTEYNKMIKTYQDLFNQKYTTEQDYRRSDKQRQIMEGQ